MQSQVGESWEHLAAAGRAGKGGKGCWDLEKQAAQGNHLTGAAASEEGPNPPALGTHLAGKDGRGKSQSDLFSSCPIVLTQLKAERGDPCTWSTVHKDLSLRA